MDALTLLTVAAAFLVVAAAPGPANLGCAFVSLRHGRVAGLRFALGLALGLTLWGVLAASGMGAILTASAGVLTALKLAGAAYLLWLAYHAARSAASSAEPDPLVLSNTRWFRQGLLLNLSNPKAVLAWMAALAMGLDTSADVHSVALATLVCSLIGLANYLIWALAFSMEPAMRAYRRLRRWLDACVASLFALAGFALIRTAFAR
jgi:threonine/homoserine/homoserine lactone efflux protein